MDDSDRYLWAVCESDADVCVSVVWYYTEQDTVQRLNCKFNKDESENWKCILEFIHCSGICCSGLLIALFR